MDIASFKEFTFGNFYIEFRLGALGLFLCFHWFIFFASDGLAQT